MFELAQRIYNLLDELKEQQDKTPEDAREVAKLINYVLTLYTIAS